MLAITQDLARLSEVQRWNLSNLLVFRPEKDAE